MNLVDSSGWLEYAAEGPNAALFAAPIEDTANLLVPTICVLEVFKRLKSQRGEATALQVLSAMQLGRVVDLDFDLALAASDLGLRHKLPLADSVILATARTHDATLWTQDADFKGLPGVRFIRHH
ncbi:MAG: type II toxin-antitoxin system VapC family toxin [Candidatus Coatesbacteria bacterium]